MSEQQPEYKLDPYLGLMLPFHVAQDGPEDSDEAAYVVSYGCGFSYTILSNGSTVMSGDHADDCEHQQASWSMSVPYKGSDLSWVEDTEQPYENWRYYHTRDGWYTLLLKHDGCVELSQAANVPFFIGDHQLTEEERDRVNHDCDEMIHMCDVRQHIKLLEAVVPLADTWWQRSMY